MYDRRIYTAALAALWRGMSVSVIGVIGNCVTPATPDVLWLRASDDVGQDLSLRLHPDCEMKGRRIFSALYILLTLSYAPSFLFSS